MMTKMTNKTIELDGVKYQLVPFDDTTEDNSLHQVIVQWVDDDRCTPASELVDRIERWLPEPAVRSNSEWVVGYNTYRSNLIKKLR